VSPSLSLSLSSHVTAWPSPLLRHLARSPSFGGPALPSQPTTRVLHRRRCALSPGGALPRLPPPSQRRRRRWRRRDDIRKRPRSSPRRSSAAAVPSFLPASPPAGPPPPPPPRRRRPPSSSPPSSLSLTGPSGRQGEDPEARVLQGTASDTDGAALPHGHRFCCCSNPRRPFWSPGRSLATFPLSFQTAPALGQLLPHQALAYGSTTTLPCAPRACTTSRPAPLAPL
jgi:hypothetical protein